VNAVEIVLLRHGAVDSGRCCYGQRFDVALSDEGRAQVAVLAGRVDRGLPVVSSPAGRARATAAVLGAELTIDARWAERDFGAWESRPWEDCWAEAPEALAGIDAYVAYTPPDGEPLDAVAARVAEALDELSTPTIVVTHGGPIRLALRHVLGCTWAQAFAFDPAPATITRLVRQGDHWSVRCVGA
jgi:broad specificity phosphatase PhoE